MYLKYVANVCSCTQGKAHDSIPAGAILKVWHSSLQGKDARGFDSETQLEGGWNATFSILVSSCAHICSEHGG